MRVDPRQKIARAQWSAGAVRRLASMWWNGVPPEIIATRLALHVGCKVGPHAIVVAAAKFRCLRSPEALSKIRRLAVGSKGKASGGTPEKVERAPDQIVSSPVVLPVVQLPAAAPRLKPLAPPYRGLATLGPDPLRDIRLAQARQGSLGRL
jgi:hypothetical protein